MPKLLSGQTLRGGGSNTFISLNQAQPAFPPDADTSTGYTISTNAVQITTTTNSLGNLVHYKGEIYSNIANGDIKLTGTGTGIVVITRSTLATATNYGALVVNGGVGIGGNLIVNNDAVIHELTFGQGYVGANNIVITNPNVADTSLFTEGYNSVAIGWGALQGLSSSNKNIAIGRNALATGTEVANTIAIGDSALQKIGTTPESYNKSISDITLVSPIQLVVPDHGLNVGERVKINGIQGTTELNGQYFYVDIISDQIIELYSDNILNNPVDGGAFTPYFTAGTVTRILSRSSNFALGTSAGRELIDGDQNFFFGDGVAINLTTGSGNVFIGHDIGANMITGSDNISIMGPNLVDGLDNQINIGSVFYYDGTNDLTLETDVTLGSGTESIDCTSGALHVIGGVGITNNLNVCGFVRFNNTENSTSTTTGALVVAGGVGIGLDLNIGGSLTVGGVSGQGAGNISAGAITTTNLTVTGQALFTTTTNTTSTTTGAVVITGGVGIGQDLYVGGQIIGPGSVGIGTTSTFINVNTATTLTYYLAMVENIGGPSLVDASELLKFEGTSTRVIVASTVSSTITNVDQAFVVSGGSYVEKGIYSPTVGQPDENYLVYTPVITVSTSAPVNPRVGDFWIDPTFGVELQYISDGGQKNWIQFTGF